MSAEPAVKLHAPAPDALVSGPAPEACAVKSPVFGKRLIRLADLFALLDVSKPTGHRLLAAHKIGPSAIRLTTACVRFDGQEVDAWLTARKSDGNLHDRKSWAPVWEAIRKRK